MKIRYSRILPSPFELVGLILIDFMVILVINTRSMLQYYGLHTSTKIVHDSAGSAISNGLSKIDSFKFTDSVVTFMIWSIIGIVCFSLVQGIARIYRDIQQDRQLSSSNYVHPDNFNRSSFWHQVLLDFAGVLGCLTLLLAGLVVLLAYALPVTIAETRPFLLGVSVVGLGGLGIGIVVMYGWLTGFCCLVKLYVNRHRLATNSR